MTGKMAVTEVKVNNQITRLLKLAQVKSTEVPEISDKEKAEFALEENIIAIEQKVSELQIKTQKIKNEI